jgi:hypothetical protein
LQHWGLTRLSSPLKLGMLEEDCEQFAKVDDKALIFYCLINLSST